jgi:hypothetical protein
VKPPFRSRARSRASSLRISSAPADVEVEDPGGDGERGAHVGMLQHAADPPLYRRGGQQEVRCSPVKPKRFRWRMALRHAMR